MDNILFASVDLPLLDKQKAVKDILSIDGRFWFWDEYRATNMLPLMTKGALIGASGAQNSRHGSFEWTDYTPLVIKEWFEDVVFPWMGQRTRIMALKTAANFENKEHIDCDPHRMGTQQHKFRVVLQGRTDTLYFITNNNNICAPEIDQPFIMDGSWPHGMNNDTDQIKITIAAGAPWIGNDQYTNIKVLLNKSSIEMPKDFNKYFRASLV